MSTEEQPRREQMELFLDKFKETNYEKFDGNTFVINQLDQTFIETTNFTTPTKVTNPDEYGRMKRSTNLNVPGVLVAYNQRWSTAFYLTPEVCKVYDIEPIHINEMANIDYTCIQPYYEDPVDLDAIYVGQTVIEVPVRTGVVMPDPVVDKRKYLFELLYEQSNYEFTLDDISYIGNDEYLLDTSTIREIIKVFRLGISGDWLTVPDTKHGKL